MKKFFKRTFFKLFFWITNITDKSEVPEGYCSACRVCKTFIPDYDYDAHAVFVERCENCGEIRVHLGHHENNVLQ